MKKKVLLLAVSCKNGGLCPGGLDLDEPSKWIRIVKDDGRAGAVQGYEIDFAEPLDVITFDGRPMPQGAQQENWVIDNNSCTNLGKMKLNGMRTAQIDIVEWAYNKYSYHKFWDNYKSYLNEAEFDTIVSNGIPSESILQVSNVRIYRSYENAKKKAKIDFEWSGARYPIKGISMTDQDFYDRIDDDNEVHFDNAYIVISIPKSCDWQNPNTGEGQAYKFVSRIYDIPSTKNGQKTWELSYQMFRFGMNLTEIALERSLTEDTIAKHLTKYIDSGDIDPYDLVDNDIVNKIRKYINKNPNWERLSEIYNYFDESISYTQIRFALKCIE